MAKKKPRVVCEIYQDVGGFWRWRLRRPNGQFIACSGESFGSKGDAKRSWSNLRIGLLAIDGWYVDVVEIPTIPTPKSAAAPLTDDQQQNELNDRADANDREDAYNGTV